MPAGKFRGGFQRLDAVAQIEMVLEARAQALQDLDRLGHARLIHIDFLEAPAQGPILVENTPEFLEGSRPDTADIAGTEQRLEQVGGVHDTTGGGTGTDDGMDFVDEQDRVAPFLQLGQQSLEALLEITPVLGSRQQGTKIQRIDHARAQHVGHLAIDDALGEPFGNGCLSNPRLPHQQRIVLAPTREDLGNALEFCCATDQWIDTPCARLVIEVGSETLQRAGFSAFPGLLVLLAALDTTGARVIRDLGNAVSDEIDHIDARDILLFQQVDGLAFLFAEQGHQHVGAGDLAFSRGLHVKHRALQHPLKTERWLGLAFAVRLGYHRGRGLDELGQLPAQLSEVRAAGTQYPRRGLVVQQGQQQVLDRHELMAPRPRPLEGGVEVQLEILAQHRGSPTTATTPSRIV